MLFIRIRGLRGHLDDGIDVVAVNGSKQDGSIVRARYLQRSLHLLPGSSGKGEYLALFHAGHAKLSRLSGEVLARIAVRRRHLNLDLSGMTAIG